jgi:hypothetical protein
VAGETVDLMIRHYMARHRCGYIEAYNAVVHDDEPDEAVAAYKRNEPGLRERVKQLEVERSEIAGRLLNQRAKAIQRQTGERDYRKAFDAACRGAPEVAKDYGIPDPDRPAETPWYKRPAPEWRKPQPRREPQPWRWRNP